MVAPFVSNRGVVREWNIELESDRAQGRRRRRCSAISLISRWRPNLPKYSIILQLIYHSLVTSGIGLPLDPWSLEFPHSIGRNRKRFGFD